jgi:hypothetical protein
MFVTRGLRLQSRQISRLVNNDKTLSSFDKKDAPPQKVNPFNLPTGVNNAAGIVGLM